MHTATTAQGSRVGVVGLSILGLGVAVDGKGRSRRDVVGAGCLCLLWLRFSHRLGAGSWGGGFGG